MELRDYQKAFLLLNNIIYVDRLIEQTKNWDNPEKGNSNYIDTYFFKLEYLGDYKKNILEGLESVKKKLEDQFEKL